MTSADTRSQKYPVGIDSVSMAEIERRVPAGEAPPLPPNAQLAVIGKSIPRINGRAKVTGAAPFTVDVKLPGMLYARLLRSPLPHARVMSIDIGAAERHPGVRAIHVINDVVGYARKWDISEEEVRKKYVDQVPLKRGCTYDDVANVVVFLASDQASYMTGQAINVTGGQEMH